MGHDFITLAIVLYGVAMALSGWQYTRTRKGTCEILSSSQYENQLTITAATVPVGPGSSGGVFLFHVHDGIFGAPIVGSHAQCKVFEKTGALYSLNHRGNELAKYSEVTWWLIWCYGCLTFIVFCIMGLAATADDKDGGYTFAVFAWTGFTSFLLLFVLCGINYTYGCKVAAVIPADNGTEYVMAASDRIGSGWITARAGEYAVSNDVLWCKGDGLTRKITIFHGIRTDNAFFSDSNQPLDIAVNAMPLVALAAFFIAFTLCCIRANNEIEQEQRQKYLPVAVAPV